MKQQGTVKGLIPMYSEEVIYRWTPKAFWNHHYRENKSKKQRSWNDRDPVQSENEFLLTSLSRGKRNRLQINIADFEFLKTKPGPHIQANTSSKTTRNLKEAPFWQSQSEKDRHQNEEAPENQTQQINWNNKIQHSCSKDRPSTVSKVRPKKTTSFE